MSSHFLADKGLALESRFGGFAVAGAQAFPEPGVAPRYAPDRGVRVDHLDIELHIDPVAQTLSGRTTVTVSARLRPASLSGNGSAEPGTSGMVRMYHKAVSASRAPEGKGNARAPGCRAADGLSPELTRRAAWS